MLSLLAITIVLSFSFYQLKKKDNTIQNWQKFIMTQEKLKWRYVENEI